MGPDKIITSHADVKFGIQPAHRTGNRMRLAGKVGVPPPPVQIGTFNVGGIDLLAERTFQSLQDGLFAAVNHLLLDLDNLARPGVFYGP